MERKYFKALNFDLDTHQLKAHYPGANYRQAYDDLRRFLNDISFPTARVPDTHKIQNSVRQIFMI